MSYTTLDHSSTRSKDHQTESAKDSGHYPALHPPRAAGEPGAIEKGDLLSKVPFKKTPGSALLSHKVSQAVPSAQEGLTTVFGMGTGVTPPLSQPRISKNKQPIAIAGKAHHPEGSDPVN